MELPMSIRWIKNVVVDGARSVLEIQLGDRKIGDKCYTRIGTEVEKWFDNLSETREDVIAQGLDILKRRCSGKSVAYPDGRPYDWQ
jgi:hypothetical protein